jgi:hypothetical protein
VNYASNSHNSRDKSPEGEGKEKRKLEKVTTGTVIKKKKSLGSKVAETFTGDSLNSVGTYVLFDVILPKAKDMFLDAINQGAERALYGDGSPRGSSSPTRGTTRHTSYNSYSSRGVTSSEPRSFSHRGRATHDFDEIVLATRGEAERVLSELCALIDDYEAATVADLYELTDITPSSQDEKWGWDDLGPATITRKRDGYLLNLPRPIVLD